MSDYGDNIKYKWTPESTTLLVSVWTDKQVQKQLEYAQRPHLIWESVARYMRKKGYTVSAKQCRSRMKQVLVCYREAKRAGTRAGVEQYYESIDKVLKEKKAESNDTNGVDTVDAIVPVKSPPKDVKTNKNLRMRFNKYSEPIESLIRTEALSPTWHLANEEDYPDSAESNETVLPYRTFSPTRDAATNTLNSRSQLLMKGTRRAASLDDQPIREARPLNPMPNNRFGEMLYQNAVQNVQNQIIQENMQQRNLLQSQFIQSEGTSMFPQQDFLYRRNGNRNDLYYGVDEIAPTKLRVGNQRADLGTANNPRIIENTVRTQNQLQQTCGIDNRAMPQEPRRGNFAQNLAMNYKHYKDGPPNGFFIDTNVTESRQRSTNYSPETAVNLNEAFCQVNKDDKNHNLNDNYDQQPMDDVIRGMNATTITHNATFNDDTISIEFLEGSQSPSDNGATGSKSLSDNCERVPNVPVRKKKVQKLEQLMLNAITSQTEVVNKILAAQDAMVSRFLDLDRDRQNRLENRLDHLMNVVYASVLNKSSEKDSESNVPAVSTEPVITSLAPPPRPGTVPPKLDLVPPKPCRVPCTTSNVELINQNPVQTRPGIVSPIKQPGAIWSKLGPVSQSPFVKAQQQLGLRGMSANSEIRTQSSAERKISQEMAELSMDRRALIYETEKFLEIEKHTEEQSENAKIITKMGQEVAARKKLFDSRREPNPGIILSAAFLDAERYVSSINCDYPKLASSSSGGVSGGEVDDDEELLLLAGQVDNYERLRRLNMPSEYITKPCDSSTPAKLPMPEKCLDKEEERSQVPKQTIQQLAQLVMKSARWRDATGNEQATNRFPPTFNQRLPNDFNIPPRRNELNDVAKRNDELIKREQNLPARRSYAEELAEKESRNKALGWLQDRYSYGCENPIVPTDRDVANHRASREAPTALAAKSYPIGFSMDNILRNSNQNRQIPSNDRRVDFNPDIVGTNTYARRNVGFVDFDEPIVDKVPTTYPRQRHQTHELAQPLSQKYYDNNSGKYSTLPVMHRHMIDRYVQGNNHTIARKLHDRDEQVSDEDEEFLDTTTSMHPQPRKTSLTSSSGKPGNCAIS